MRADSFKGIQCLLLILLVSCAPAEKKDKGPKEGYDEYEIADSPESSGGKSPKTYTVEIKQMKYEPSVLHVHRGDQIIWVNRDIVDHDVTEQTRKAWTSSKLPTGASWSRTAAGSELYYCSIHLVMKGKIVVDDADISMLSDAGMTMCK